jgi:tRNA threonylcarbamoyladenosine biosynthesis protein TsaE
MTVSEILSAEMLLETDTQAFAARLAPLLRPGDWLLLNGTLGAGKTTFARSLLRALGHPGEVPSPTFTLIQTYEGTDLPYPVWHVDLYRLEAAQEVRQLGLGDAGDEVLLIIEWPDRLGMMPDHALRIDFSVGSGHRRISLHGASVWRERLRPLVGQMTF